jgi:serine/threonine protein phosphatase 1
MGNHESIFLEYLFGGDEKTFLVNGGLPTLDSYRKNSDIFIPPEHVSFIQSMATHIELDNYYIVHAGFKPGVKIEDQGIKDMLWIRESFITSDYAFGKKVIFGHTPFYSPYVTENKIGIDTGAVFGNKLTCIELPDEKFYFVEKLP